MAHEVEGHGAPSPDQLSRRALLRRAGQGAVVAGLAAWVVPEIIVASPAGAQPLSAPPGGGGGPSTGPGGGGSPMGGGSTPGTGGGGGGTGPGTGGGGALSGPETGGQSPGTSPSGESTPSGTGAGAAPVTAGQAGGHGTLAFTGFDPETLLGVGSALVAGGWTINRWASRLERPPEPEPPAG